MRALTLATTLALTALLLTACGSSDSGDSGTTKANPAPTKPIYCPDGSDFDASTLTGKSEADAKALAKKNNCDMRVTERDGEMFPMTMDFRENRVNVVVTDGKVSEVTGIG